MTISRERDAAGGGDPSSAGISPERGGPGSGHPPVSPHADADGPAERLRLMRELDLRAEELARLRAQLAEAERCVGARVIGYVRDVDGADRRTTTTPARKPVVCATCRGAGRLHPDGPGEPPAWRVHAGAAGHRLCSECVDCPDCGKDGAGPGVTWEDNNDH